VRACDKREWVRHKLLRPRGAPPGLVTLQRGEGGTEWGTQDRVRVIYKRTCLQSFASIFLEKMLLLTVGEICSWIGRWLEAHQ